MITEDLPIILYRTCGGSLDQIKSLAQDRKADDYVSRFGSSGHDLCRG